MGRTLITIAALILISGLSGAVYSRDGEHMGSDAPAPRAPVNNPVRPKAPDIDRYYERATGVDDALLPEGLRTARWGDTGTQKSATPVITSECLRYDSGEFSRLFFASPYGKRIKELFAENGINADKLANLLRAHSARGRETVSVFDEGYLILTDQDEKVNYILPIGKGMGQKLFNLSQ